MLVDATQASDSKGTVEPMSSRILMVASLLSFVPQWRIMVTMGTLPALGGGGPLPGGKVCTRFMTCWSLLWLVLSSALLWLALHFRVVPVHRCRSASAGEGDLSNNPTSWHRCLILQWPKSSEFFGLPQPLLSWQFGVPLYPPIPGLRLVVSLLH